jgi:hypothetical protein
MSIAYPLGAKNRNFLHYEQKRNFSFQLQEKKSSWCRKIYFMTSKDVFPQTEETEKKSFMQWIRNLLRMHHERYLPAPATEEGSLCNRKRSCSRKESYMQQVRSICAS